MATEQTVVNETLHRGSYLLYPDQRSPETAWPADTELALLILNEPLPPSKQPLFSQTWARANYRICVDGGTNWLHALGSQSDTLDQLIPDAIVGDLDSLNPEPKAYYEGRGTVVHRYSDQILTDFMKGLRYLDTEMRGGRDPRACVVVVFGGLGGRLDHIMHTLKVLFNNHEQRQIIVVSDENLTFVLPRGRNRILTDDRVDGPTCGILPLAGETMLTTDGLRWNLDNHPSSFEGLMSTSNIIDKPQIDVDTTVPVTWTAQFRPQGD